MSKFEEKFKNLLTEDESEKQAQKSWNVVNSAFLSKIAILESELVEAKFKEEDAESKLEQAKINFGKVVNDRELYINYLIYYKNSLIDIQNEVKELEETILFLKNTYEELK